MRTRVPGMSRGRSSSARQVPQDPSESGYRRPESRNTAFRGIQKREPSRIASDSARENVS